MSNKTSSINYAIGIEFRFCESTIWNAHLYYFTKAFDVISFCLKKFLQHKSNGERNRDKMTFSRLHLSLYLETTEPHDGLLEQPLNKG